MLSKEEIENFIQEMTEVRPDKLNEEGLRLYNTIMQILDKNEQLETENKELETNNKKLIEKLEEDIENSEKGLDTNIVLIKEYLDIKNKYDSLVEKVKKKVRYFEENEEFIATGITDINDNYSDGTVIKRFIDTLQKLLDTEKEKV